MKRKILSVLLILLVLYGCTPTITSGEVIDKEFEPAHVELRYIPVVHSNGKTTYTTTMLYTYYYPDTYRIVIRGVDSSGEQQTERFRVTKEVYDAVTIGAEFVYMDEMKPSEPEYERKPGNNTSDLREEAENGQEQE